MPTGQYAFSTDEASVASPAPEFLYSRAWWPNLMGQAARRDAGLPLRSRLNVAPTLLDDGAPCAPLAPRKAPPRPQQPHAAPHQLGRQRRPMERGGAVGSK